MRLLGDDMPDDDTPPNGHTRTTVPGGEVGDKIRRLEVEDVTLRAYVDAKIDEVKAEIGTVRTELGAKLDKIAEAYTTTLLSRFLTVAQGAVTQSCEVARLAVDKGVTSVSAPIYAIAFLVAVVALTTVTVRYGDLFVGRAMDADANEDSASDVGVSGAGVEPNPEP